MKKIYSLLAMVLMASASFAQTISATVNGVAVSNGETVECKFDEIERHPVPVLTVYEMTPHVLVKSDVEQKVTLSIDVLEKKGDDQIQNCFVNCITANSGNNFVVTESVEMSAGQEKDAMIHFTTKTNPNERPLDRHVLVTVSTDKESISFTLHMFWDPDGTLHVDNLGADQVNAPAYLISGANVKENNIPAGSIYVKGGKKYIKK